MKLIFDVRDEKERFILAVLQPYFDSLKYLAFEDELWVTQAQKDTAFKDCDKFYRGVPIVIKGV